MFNTNLERELLFYLIKYLMKTKRNYRISKIKARKAFIKQEAMCHKTHCFLFYNLNLYPTPQIVSIYCGLLVFISIFSRIFLICTVTVAISPTDSISQISRNNSSSILIATPDATIARLPFQTVFPYRAARGPPADTARCRSGRGRRPAGDNG